MNFYENQVKLGALEVLEFSYLYTL